MKRLLDIGFRKVGSWKEDANLPIFKLRELADTENVLYAFVVEDNVKYIGKTIQSLKKRMSGYQNPGPTQSTNIKIHERITWELTAGKRVEIYVFPDSGLLSYGGFHVNLAAGLEDSIILALEPKWNTRGTKQVLQSVDREYNTKPNSLSTGVLPRTISSKKTSPVFKLVLHKTYYNQGFFNVTQEFDACIGDGKSNIEIHLAGTERIIQGKINRSANSNGTARIMGTSVLRDWFQSRFEVKDSVKVEFLSPYQIRLT